MDDRKAVQVLCVWLCRDNVVVVGDEFCVHAGFLSNGNDVLQSFVLVDAERDGDLVVGIIGNDRFQIVDIPDDMHVTVGFSVPFAIVQNAVDHVAPFRMGADAVDIALCRAPVTDEQDVLEIVSFFPELAQDRRDEQTEKKFKNKIDHHEYNDKKTSVISASFYEIQAGGTIKDTDHVRFKDIVHL